jgi:NADPH:quinone reductase-like Zn-dependent oxidoreductase
MGAHAVVDGKRIDIDDHARRFAPDGVDAVLALAGGDALERCLNVLQPGGRVAHPNGVEPAQKRRRGMTLVRYDGISGVREFERLTAAVQAARLKVPIAECYPLAGAYKAHERLAEGHVVEKLSLRCMIPRVGFNRIEPHCSLIFLIEQGFFGNPVSTFPDHAPVAGISGRKQSSARR